MGMLTISMGVQETVSLSQGLHALGPIPMSVLDFVVMEL